VAPPPERPFTVTPASDERDTYRSPIPLVGGRESAGAAKATAARVTPSAGPPRPAQSTRTVAPQAPLLAVIEALRALRRIDDVVEGAALVLKTALEAIPSASGFVHVSDVATRDFVVVAASGAHSADVIGTRTSESDPILAKAHGDLEAITVSAASRPLFAGTRFRRVPPVHAVLCAPAHYDGRVLGAVELVDAAHGPAFSDADRHALTYVGERFAEFLSDRSLAF